MQPKAGDHVLLGRPDRTIYPDTPTYIQEVWRKRRQVPSMVVMIQEDHAWCLMPGDRPHELWSAPIADLKITEIASYVSPEVWVLVEDNDDGVTVSLHATEADVHKEIHARHGEEGEPIEGTVDEVLEQGLDIRWDLYRLPEGLEDAPTDSPLLQEIARLNARIDSAAGEPTQTKAFLGVEVNDKLRAMQPQTKAEASAARALIVRVYTILMNVPQERAEAVAETRFP